MKINGDDLMRVYPALRVLRGGMTFVSIAHTVEMLACQPADVHRVLRQGYRLGLIELAAHSMTQGLTPAARAALLPMGCELMGYWRPTCKQ